MKESLPHEPLPDLWIERIFSRLQGMYGSLWLDRWRDGTTVEHGGRQFDGGLLTAKSAWSMALSGFRNQPKCIAAAINACHAKPLPPTLPEFLELCREDARRRAGAGAALPYKPTAEESEAARKAAQMATGAIRKMADSVDFMAWASNPPSPENQGPWERFLTEGARQSNRLRATLAKHVRSGVCRSRAAREAVAEEEAQ